MLVGINDEADTLYGDPATAFATLKTLKTQVLRVNLYWGGNKWAVANSKPTDPTDPGDPAYNWSLYDRLVKYAPLNNIQVVFSILFTPGVGERRQGPDRRADESDRSAELRRRGGRALQRLLDASVLAAERDRSGSATSRSRVVNMWTAWNEPNNPDWLTPQYKRVGGKWRIESAYQYAKICNAVYSGVHGVLISPDRGLLTGEQVACGVTGPKGNDAPTSKRPSVDPLSFLIAAHGFGMKKFDVYAHHPYADAGSEGAGVRPERARTSDGSSSATSTCCSPRSRSSTGRSISGSPSTATRPIRPTRRSSASAGRSRQPT